MLTNASITKIANIRHEPICGWYFMGLSEQCFLIVAAKFSERYNAGHFHSDAIPGTEFDCAAKGFNAILDALQPQMAFTIRRR